ncbi:MAG: carbohydrate ABC transporter permease [Firmicutes bacterium]|nr:carbohydrate ABC transporter permease [Bacillota bacterium]
MKKSYSKKKTSVSRKLFRVFNTLFMAFLIMSIILPFVYIFEQSVVNYTLFGAKITVPPFDWTAVLYKEIFTMKSLYRPLMISVFTTVMTTIFGLIVSSISAYILIQKNMPGRKLFLAMIIIAFVFDAGIIPQFIVIYKLKLLNSLAAVIIPLSLNIFNIVLMKNYFESLPQSILDAAEIDGCTPANTFVKIVLPMSKPALAAIGFFFAAAAWSEYISYVMYINDTLKQNFQYKLREEMAAREFGCAPIWNPKSLSSACIVVSALPIVILSLFAQKFYTPEFTMASVKE